VTAWLRSAKAMSVVLPAGVEPVQTACGLQQPAFAKESQTVTADDLGAAQALLGRLNAADAPSADLPLGGGTTVGGASSGGAADTTPTKPTGQSPRVLSPGDVVSEPPLEPNKLIESAKTQLENDNPGEAEAMLNRFLELYPNHARVGEATYRRAEAAMKAKQYKHAIIRFQSVIDQFKSSSWAAWAMLRQGECFEEQDQQDNARVFFSEVVRLYPRSQAAATAKRKLGQR
jgi:tol-pal system protein YbgF